MTVGLAVLSAAGITYEFNNGLLADGTTTVPLVKDFDVPHVATQRPHHHRRRRGRAITLITQRGDGQRHVDHHLRQRGEPHAGPVRRRPGREGQLRLRHLLHRLPLMMIVAIVFVEQGQRRIPVQFAKRVVASHVLRGGQKVPTSP